MLRLTVGVMDVGGHAPNALAAAAVHTAPSIGADSPAQQLVRNPVRSSHLLQQVTVAGALVAPAAGEQECVQDGRASRSLNCQQPNECFTENEAQDDGGDRHGHLQRQLALTSSARGAVAAAPIDGHSNNADESARRIGASGNIKRSYPVVN